MCCLLVVPGTSTSVVLPSTTISSMSTSTSEGPKPTTGPCECGVRGAGEVVWGRGGEVVWGVGGKLVCVLWNFIGMKCFPHQCTYGAARADFMIEWSMHWVCWSCDYYMTLQPLLFPHCSACLPITYNWSRSFCVRCANPSSCRCYCHIGHNSGSGGL